MKAKPMHFPKKRRLMNLSAWYHQNNVEFLRNVPEKQQIMSLYGQCQVIHRKFYPQLWQKLQNSQPTPAFPAPTAVEIAISYCNGSWSTIASWKIFGWRGSLLIQLHKSSSRFFTTVFSQVCCEWHSPKGVFFRYNRCFHQLPSPLNAHKIASAKRERIIRDDVSDPSQPWGDHCKSWSQQLMHGLRPLRFFGYRPLEWMTFSLVSHVPKMCRLWRWRDPP